MRSIVVVIADPHCGSSLGLCNPATKLPGTDKVYRPVTLSPNQLVLWSQLQSDLASVRDKANGDPIYILSVSDLCQGLCFPVELMETAVSNHVFIAAGVLHPFLSLPNVRAVRLATGTRAHTFGEGSAELLAAAMLKPLFPSVDIGVVDHGCATLGGMTIDYAHHGPAAGSRTWLKGNVARLYAQSIQQAALMDGETPPSLIIRGHVHEPVWVTTHALARGQWWTTDLAVIPPMVIAGEYAVKVARSPGVCVTGLVTFVVDENTITPDWRMHTWDLVRREIF